MIYFSSKKVILSILIVGMTHYCTYSTKSNKTVVKHDVQQPGKPKKSLAIQTHKRRVVGNKKNDATFKQTSDNEPAHLHHEATKKKTIQVRKRSTNGRKKKNTTLKQMNDNELAQLQREAISKKNFPLAIKCLERRMKLSTSPAMLANLIFELGEMQFEFGKLDSTIVTLNEFKKQFPGHKEIEEAYYKTCVASFLNTLGSERDQTNTDIAFNLAEEYLVRGDFQKYRHEVETFKKQALKQKANHELLICKFHTKRGHITAAKKRIEHVEKEFTDLPELTSQILALKEEIFTLEQKKSPIVSNHRIHKKYKDRF